MGGFEVLLGDFISAFPLSLEGNGFSIPVIDGRENHGHGHDMVHEGGRDAGREVSDKDVLIGNAYKGGVVLEMRDILNKGQEIGVVFSFGHAFGGEPGNGIAGNVMVFEHGFKLLDEVGEGSNGDGSARDGILSDSSCPGKGRSLDYIRQGKGNFLVDE